MQSVTKSPAGGVREARRLETRARLYDAALDEISREDWPPRTSAPSRPQRASSGEPSTFTSRPRKQVLVEAERNEETRIVGRNSS